MASSIMSPPELIGKHAATNPQGSSSFMLLRPLKDLSAANRNKYIVTIKVAFGGDLIKFYLHISQATVGYVKKEINKRFKSLGNYKLMFYNEYGNLILINYDGDMRKSIKWSRSVGQTAVRLRILTTASHPTSKYEMCCS